MVWREGIVSYWPDVHAAIRAAKKGPSVGIDYARVAGDRYQADQFIRAKTLVLAVLGKLPRRERKIIEAYACTGLGYREIAKMARLSPTHTRRLHLQAVEFVEKRLKAMDLIPEENMLAEGWHDGTP